MPEYTKSTSRRQALTAFGLFAALSILAWVWALAPHSRHIRGSGLLKLASLPINTVEIAFAVFLTGITMSSTPKMLKIMAGEPLFVRIDSSGICVPWRNNAVIPWNDLSDLQLKGYKTGIQNLSAALRDPQRYPTASFWAGGLFESRNRVFVSLDKGGKVMSCFLAYRPDLVSTMTKHLR